MIRTRGTMLISLGCLLAACGGGSQGETAPGAELASSTEALRGDANADGVVDSADAASIRDYLGGASPEPFNPYDADADCDGRITVVDADRVAASAGGELACPSPGLGDVNGNGSVDANDQQELSRFVAGTVPAPFYEKVADVDCSGTITADDAARLSELLPVTQPLYCPDPELGDANWDGQVNAADVALVRARIAGELPAGFHPHGADANCDGEITEADARRIETAVGSLSCPEPALGDANVDGALTPDDAAMIRAYSGGGAPLGLDVQAADADCDGQITEADAVRVESGSGPLTCADPVRGDATGDGAVDVLDALGVARRLEGMPGSPFFAAAADVDCDGRISENDRARYVAYLNNAITSFECPSPTRGDANGDSSVTGADAAAIRDALSGGAASALYAAAADVDCDGVVSADDAVRIEAFVAGSGGLECPAHRRGDANADGHIDILDALAITAQPPGMDRLAADANCDGALDGLDQQLIATFSTSALYPSIQCDWSPRVNLDTPQGATVNVPLTLAAQAVDGPLQPLDGSAVHWEIERLGLEPQVIRTGTGGTLTHTFVAEGRHRVRVKAVDPSGSVAVAERELVVRGLEGRVALSDPQGMDLVTTLAIGVTPAEVGSYVHVTLDSDAPMKAVIRDESGRAVAEVSEPYRSPELEWKSVSSGPYILTLSSNRHLTRRWQTAYAAPAGMRVGYRIEKAATSPAAAAGRSVYVVRESWPETFHLDLGGTLVHKSGFDFDALERDYNAVFARYVELFGSDRTNAGTMVGVAWPQDPEYPYGGDASNPIRIRWMAERGEGWPAFGPFAFEHELGHLFTLAYPFAYSFVEEGGSRFNNVEHLPVFLQGYVTDPRARGVFSMENWLRWEAELYDQSGMLRNPAHWHDAVTTLGLPLIVRSASGGWDGLASVFAGYAQRFPGATQGGALEQAGEFYLSLAESIPDPEKRAAMHRQLAYWGCPFAQAGLAPVDADGDGLVQGLDTDDGDATRNQYTEECTDTRCVPNGIDENGNGFADEFMLDTLGSRTPVELGVDTPNRTELGTRRRLWLAAGSRLQISADSAGAPVGLALWHGHVPTGKTGPMRYQNVPLVAQTTATLNPATTVTIPQDGVYTLEFTGDSTTGTPRAHRIAYTARVLCSSSSQCSVGACFSGVCQESGGAQLTASLRPQNEWETGFCAEVDVTNGTSQTVSGWSVALGFSGATLSNGWSATFAGSGASYTVTPLSWNSTIAPGASATFGFCAAKQVPQGSASVSVL